MYSKILILKFPSDKADKPVICNLVQKYNLIFNILNARILPRKEGMMALKLSGTKENFKQGIEYLRKNGICVEDAKQFVTRDEEACYQCGACTAVCPTEALFIKRPEMEICFDQKKCSMCELCLSICPTKAMKVFSSVESFF